MTQAQAFDLMLSRMGEMVTFRGTQVRALVNRTPGSPGSTNTTRGAGPSSAVSISTEAGVVIQIAASNSAPLIGDVFTDQYSLSHRATLVRHFGHCWNCECETA